MSNPFKANDKIICIDAKNSHGRLTEGETYTVREAHPNGYIKLVERPGIYYAKRFEPASKAKAKPTPFGQVKAVTVNKADVLAVLTQYVRFGLGIDATVAKLVDKFPEAIELVLSSEAAA
ncbi:hypothetical protein [Mesorhizobium sp. M0571]|uniref:hypothetical protein n=1 Tax=Mesorhizobium sp. M0571 TaxID=2956960 RepID=UPI0033379720